MMINDNIDFLNEAKKLFEDIANNPSINETVKTYFIIESLESAIDIMRKYQKIQEIYQKWNEVNDFEYNQAMLQIGKVLESEEIPND